MTDDEEIKVVGLMAAILGSTDEVGWNPESNIRIVNEAMDLLNEVKKRIILRSLKDALDAPLPLSGLNILPQNREL